ncbi:Single-stranded DNA-binding protein [Dissostichus eleginoides]|uniref:Single-stranded DNA-binding protein n=1 Tax=Dissostichus eleginoides TaxID=100907 RepID=A0AAD9CPR1_DISEL|nr:Single-stranded DNA-binding protein [Dissostichus eleginoides]
MDRFTFVIGKKRGRVDDVGGDPHTPNSSNGNANVVEDIVMPNMEDNEDKEDDEEEEENKGHFSTMGQQVISKRVSPMPGVETGEKEQRNWPNTT